MAQVRHQTETIESDKVEEAFHGQRDALDELFVDQSLLVPVEDIRAIANVLPVHDEQQGEVS